MMEEGWPRAAEPCGGAPRWHGRVSDEGEAVAFQLRRARWRGSQGDASDVGELAREGRLESCPHPRPNVALSARRREKRQIGAWQCLLHGWVGSGSGGHDGEALDALNRMEVIAC